MAKFFWLVTLAVAWIAFILINPTPSESTTCADCDFTDHIDFDHFALQNVSVTDTQNVTVLRSIPRMPEHDTIIFIHGFPDNLHSFSHQMGHFAKLGFNTISVSLRGYTDAADPPLTNFTIAAGADELLRIVSRLRLTDGLHLVGHDWGSTVAAEAATRHPTQFRSLTLVSVPNMRRCMPAILSNPLNLLPLWYMLFFQLPLLPEKWVQSCDGVTFLWNQWEPASYSRQRRLSVCATLSNPKVVTHALGWYRHNILQSLRSTSSDAEIRVPTLGVVGSNDGCVSKQTFTAGMQPRDFPLGHEVHVIEGAGHFVHHSHSTQFNKILYDFISTKRRKE